MGVGSEWGSRQLKGMGMAELRAGLGLGLSRGMEVGSSHKVRRRSQKDKVTTMKQG